MAHIVRIDNPKANPHRGTHGWQVRMSGSRGYHSKFFSDSLYAGKEGAWSVAEEYLNAYLAAHPEEKRGRYPDGYKKGLLQSNNHSGVNGVYRTHTIWKHGGGKGGKVYYWAAFCPRGPAGQVNSWSKRFYIHHHGEAEAKRLAIEFRRGWEMAADEGEKAIAQFFAQQLAEERQAIES